jgi:ATP-dependent exoDNAse (exonuclease V) beta subunit
LPSPDELAVWNNAEAPEPPSNLTATVKGAVIHRFCERYTPDQNIEECLQRSFAEIIRFRQAELADRLVELNTEAALKDLLPLAQNYLQSDVYARVEQARAKATEFGSRPGGDAGMWSELPFRMRRPLSVVSGAIDKLLITKTESGHNVEIIDFKTNRIPKPPIQEAEEEAGAQASLLPPVATKSSKPYSQFAFDFDPQPVEPKPTSFDEALKSIASDYRLQMQAYALAIRELMPSLELDQIKVTLHFLDPNIEVHIDEPQLEADACAEAIDKAILDIVSSSEPAEYPVKPATHCRMCNFLNVCTAGREYLES